MRIAGFLLLACLFTGVVSSARSSAQTTQSASPNAVSSGTTPNPQANPPNATPATEERDSSSNGDRKFHLRLATIALGAGYGYSPGPVFYPYGPYNSWFYPSALWYPYWGAYGAGFPFYPPGYFSPNSGRGEVKLTTDPKTAEVYLDHAYAGSADHLKSMWLDPGAYDLSLSAKGCETFQQRVYVLSGKSLKITARLVPEKAKE